jgi:hypothetical protein
MYCITERQRAHIRNTTIRDITHKTEKKEEPRLGVHEELGDLVPTNPFGLTTILVLPESGDQEETIVARKEACRRNAIREEENDDDAPD